MFLALKCLRKNKSSRNISFEIFHSHNTTCNWVNLLQVSSGQFMCCGQVFTGFTAYAELWMWTGKTFWCYADNQKKTQSCVFVISSVTIIVHFAAKLEHFISQQLLQTWSLCFDNTEHRFIQLYLFQNYHNIVRPGSEIRDAALASYLVLCEWTGHL